MPVDPELLTEQVEEKELASSRGLTVDANYTGGEIGPILRDGHQCVAELTLGGHGKDRENPYRPQKVYIFKINDFESPDFVNLEARAKAVGVNPSEYMLLATTYEGPEGALSAGAFLPYTGLDPHNMLNFAELGRAGNIRWFEYGIDKKRDAGWTPFKGNRSISRSQLRITRSGQDELSFLNLSQNSKTLVKGKFTDAAYNSYDPNQAEELQSERSRAGGKLARLLRGIR